MCDRSHLKKPDYDFVIDGIETFIVRNGVRVARRRHPGTPGEGKWIPMLMGVTINETPDGKFEIKDEPHNKRWLEIKE